MSGCISSVWTHQLVDLWIGAVWVRGQRFSTGLYLCDVLQVLNPLLRSCSEDTDGGAIFVPRCMPSGAFQEVQCGRGECWCVDPQGREVVGSRSPARPPRCPTPCERQRDAALKVRANMAAGAEIHIPACSEMGDFLPLQCIGSRCFCVDPEGRSTTAASAGGAVSCKTPQHV